MEKNVLGKLKEFEEIGRTSIEQFGYVELGCGVWWKWISR
jgi:hypothetical protein